MQKLIIFLLFFLYQTEFSSTKENIFSIQTTSFCYKLYNEMELKNKVNFNAFEYALEACNKLELKNKDIITLIDFSKPSTEERLFVLDLKNRKLLISSHVAHGKNSGENYAKSFSNKKGSNKSSIGFFVTENTYQGRNGYSLVLNGLEKGINDNAKMRSIVIHGADYTNPNTASYRLGRSQGCPAVPHYLNKQIIDTIKGGTLLFIYAKDNNYFEKSNILSTSREG